MGRKKHGHKNKVRKSKQAQLAGQEEDYKKAPHSFVFHRGHVGKNIKQLVSDTRYVMKPYTASKLQARRKNVLKDFISVAGSLNVTNFLIFTKTEISTNLKICRLPRGPTVTFKVHNYSLRSDVISALKKTNMEQKQFQHHPLLVMNNFSGEAMHLKLLSTMFQNMFPSINVNQVKLDHIRRCVLLNYDPESKLIEFRHYNIRVVPVGMSRGVKKLIKATVPDMSRYYDVSEYITKGGNLSESEAELDGDHNEVTLPQKLGSRGNIKSAKSAIRLTELGPRLTLQLVKIEEGVCEGQVLFHEFITKTKAEVKALKSIREQKRKLKEARKRKQQENVTAKKTKKEEHKQRSLEGMKKGKQQGDMEEEVENPGGEASGSEDETAADIEYFKKEVGQAPEPELFPSTKGRKRKRNTRAPVPYKKKKIFKTKDSDNKKPFNKGERVKRQKQIQKKIPGRKNRVPKFKPGNKRK